MKVEFRKTGERRYAVIIERDGLPNLEMNPAPGFDALMPHDMLHFLVEQELELRRGIFGQIAAGGTAGTFHQAASENANRRAAARARRKTARRGSKLLKANTDDCAQSERATYICLYDWLAHSADDSRRARALEMSPNYESIFAQLPERERQKLDREKRAAIRKRMDELSDRWSALGVNQSMTLDWQ